ncbi:hypothetical protein EGW08_017696, partial [Elysia chlorotica]
PDDREKDGEAAEQIHPDENLVPGVVRGVSLLALLHDNPRDVHQDLEQGHSQKQFLLSVGEHVFDERPAGSDQQDCDKHQSSTH